MAKSTREHEHIIDIFDRIITFSYAYEWQKKENSATDEIFKLRDLIASHIENKQSDLFKTSNATESAVIGILNRLQRAVLDDSCPIAMVFADVWLNKPDNMSNQYLDQTQYKEGRHILFLIMRLVSRLMCSIPNEMKPFVTFQQVDAIFKESSKEMPDDFKVPIHKELLVSMCHQHFLKTFDLEENTFRDVDAYLELTEKYCAEAVKLFVAMVKEDTINNCVIKFFSQAKDINLEIDRFYSWGQICVGPVPYQEILSLYSNLNANDQIKDALYKRVKNLEKISLNSKQENIIKDKGGYLPSRFVSKGFGIIRYTFDSNDTHILIEGKSLQNHIVMAFPYDKPLSDLQGKLQNYGGFIRNAVFSYGRDYGHPSGFEDEIKNVLAFQNIYPLYKRLSLTDGGSVLKHLCTLLWFEFERSNDYLDNKNNYESQYRYQDVNSMIELIKNHGFDYKFCSVRTARTSKEKNMIKIKNRIFKLQ